MLGPKGPRKEEIMSKANSKIVLDPKELHYGNHWSTIKAPAELRQGAIEPPKPGVFFRTHPRRSHVANIGVIHDGSVTPFLVLPKLYKHLDREVVVKRAYTTVTAEGTAGLWLLRVPDHEYYEADLPDWSHVALEAAELAKEEWVAITWNPVLGYYQIRTAKGDLPDPDWERVPPFKTLLEKAFGDRVIASVEHPLVEWNRSVLDGE
jgi:hypothetical protein